MFAYVVRRVITGLLVLVVVSLATFSLFFYGPSNPAQAYCPENKCTPERLALITKTLGLDRPMPEQYAEYMKGLVAGRTIGEGDFKFDCSAPCLGVSFKYRVPVREYLMERFPATLSIAVGGAVVFLTMGLIVGIFAARNRGTPIDKGLVGASLIVNAIPYYLLALLVWLYLINKWGILPPSGYFSPTKQGVWAWFTGLLAPWLVIGLTYSTSYARFSRGSLIEALSEDYVRTARAKGLTERVITFRHALRAAIVPVVTIFGLDFAGLLAGTIFTERIFEVRGIGLEALNSVNNQDLPIINATVLIAATFIVTANIVVDIIYSWIDPRVRL